MLLGLMVAVIWGVNFVVIDEGLGEVPPLTFVALRFVVVLLPAVFLVPKPDLPWRDLALVGGFMSLGQFGLLYSALHVGIPAGIAAILLQAQVMLTVLIAAVTLSQRPTQVQTIGIAVGAVGLAVVCVGRSAATPLLGVLLTLAAALSWASGNVLVRRMTVSSGLSMTVWSAVVVPVPLLVLSLVLDGPAAVGHGLRHLTVGNLAATAYTAYLASLLGYGTWNGLLARHSAAAVVPFALLVPPVAMTTSWLVQNEAPNVAEAVGGLVLLVGVAVTALRPRGRRPEPPKPAENAPLAEPGGVPYAFEVPDG